MSPQRDNYDWESQESRLRKLAMPEMVRTNLIYDPTGKGAISTEPSEVYFQGPAQAPPKRWRLLVNDNAAIPSAELAAAIVAAGGNVTESDDPASFDAIFLDTKARRNCQLEAGYWLASGKLVAVIAYTEGWWGSMFGRKLGGWVFRDYPEFCTWLRTGKKGLTYEDVKNLPLGPRQRVDPDAPEEEDNDATNRLR